MIIMMMIHDKYGYLRKEKSFNCELWWCHVLLWQLLWSVLLYNHLVSKKCVSNFAISEISTNTCAIYDFEHVEIKWETNTCSLVTNAY